MGSNADLLADKTVWVTGASRGIGRAVALACARQGAAAVAVAGRNGEALDALAREIEGAGGQPVLVLPYDVGKPAEIKEAFIKFNKALGRLDVMVNNAGIIDDALLGMITEAQIERVLAVNLAATIHHMQYAARLMTRQKRGSIVNIGSIMGRVGNVGQVVYAASKAGVIGATLSAAKELAPSQIRVNVVAPGFIDTEMTRGLPEEKFKERLASIRMKRVGSAEEVAQVVVFLGSDMSSYVTGQVIGVDGGMTI